MPLAMAFIKSDGTILAGNTQDGKTWTQDDGTPGFANLGQSSKATPSLQPIHDESVYPNMVAFIDSTDNLNVCWFNGTTSSVPTGQMSKAAPSLLASGAAGQSLNNVWLAFVGNTSQDLHVFLGVLQGAFYPTVPVNHKSQHGPSLAAFNGTIWTAFVGSNNDDILTCSLLFNGNTLTGWSQAYATGHSSQAAPSLTVYDDGSGEKLWLAYVAKDSNELLVISSADGTHWSSQPINTGHLSKAAPSLTPPGFGDGLIMGYVAKDSDDLLLATSSPNGRTWNPFIVTGQQSPTGPSIAGF